VTQPQVVLIAAVARNGAVGKGNALLWQERADQQHFRRVTMGCPVVMGRKTWESLPARFKPLPGRRNVVLSRDGRFSAPGAEVAPGLDSALARLADTPKVFVIGGAEVYAQALPLADALVLTEIEADFDADAFFPTWDRQAFDEVQREPQRAADGTGFAFVTYRRRPR
jgi:dihydrofolate reductase